MKITCSNQTRQSIDCQKLIQAAKHFLAGRSHQLLGLSITVVGEKRIKSINSRFRDIDQATDVLTFVHSSGTNNVIGAIILNPQRARRKHYTLSELVVHGLTHCLGVNHRLYH